MRYKIGIFGSAEELENAVKQKAKNLGIVLAKYDVLIITGACSGLPYLAAYQAAKNGKKVWGYSPELDLKSQKQFTPHDDLSIYEKIEYVPKTFPHHTNKQACKKYRNVISTANCDAGIIISGRWGTMNEFTNLYDMEKIIGVLTDTGGVADELPNLMKHISKKNKAVVVFANSSDALMQLILKELEKRRS